MEKVTRAIVRVGEMQNNAEHSLLLKEKGIREGLDQYEFSEAKVKALVERDTIDEATTVRVLSTLLRGLNARFKSLQSALSYLKQEMRL